MSPATYASSSFADGDTIVMSGLGGVYTSAIAFRGGSASGRVTTQGSNSPVIDGAVVKTGWTNYSGNVWQATVSNNPQQIWVDGTYGDRQADLESLANEFDWFWDSSTLYLYASSDPDTAYTDPGVEIVSLAGLGTTYDYCNVSGVTFRRSRYRGLNILDSSHVTISNCIAEWCWASGLVFAVNSGVTDSDIIIEDSIGRYNGRQGIDGVGVGTLSNCVVRRCTAYENGRYQYNNPYWDWDQLFSGGIKIWGDFSDSLIEQCKVYSNGPASPSYVGVWFGTGIWIDGAWATSGHENVVQHNLVYDNDGVGLYCELVDYSIWRYNVVYGNNKSTTGWSVAGIRCDSRGSDSCSNNKFYNNTIVGGYRGVFNGNQIDQGYGICSNNEFKNNIIVGQSAERIYCIYGGANDGTYGSGNTWSNNCLGAEGTNFIYWGGNYSTYDAWLSASSQSDTNVESDPQFTDSDNDDYTLVSDSPCIGAGADLGADHDDGLLPESTWPDGVVVADQDDY